MITGDEIRAARERTGLTQEQLALMANVSLRTVGNWERGQTVPRSRAAMLEQIFGTHAVAADPPSLRAVSDVELLAEIARRFARAKEDDHEQEQESRTQASGQVDDGAGRGPQGSPPMKPPPTEGAADAAVPPESGMERPSRRPHAPTRRGGQDAAGTSADDTGEGN